MVAIDALEHRLQAAVNADGVNVDRELLEAMIDASRRYCILLQGVDRLGERFGWEDGHG